jgi:hypothetical protein
MKYKTYVSCYCSAHTEQLQICQKGWNCVFFKEHTRLNISSCTLQSLLIRPNLSTTSSIHSDSVPWRGMYRHPVYEPSFCVKLMSSFQYWSHSKTCGLPTMMSSERALVTATLNLCTESKLQCTSEAMAVPTVVYRYQYIRQVPWSVTFVICTAVLVHCLALSLVYS